MERENNLLKKNIVKQSYKIVSLFIMFLSASALWSLLGKWLYWVFDFSISRYNVLHNLLVFCKNVSGIENWNLQIDRTDVFSSTGNCISRRSTPI